MLKKLLIVAASAAMLALVSISAAFVVGGPEIRAAFAEGKFVWVVGDEYDGPVIAKELTLDDAKELVITMPVNLRFDRSDTASMKVEGPQEAIDALVYENGKLAFRGSGKRRSTTLEITIAAPVLPDLRLETAGDIDLRGLDQDAFALHSSGAADVKATGRAKSLVLVTNGAADLNFEEVATGDARIEINGAGDVNLSATGEVDIEINGAGSVTLHTKPARVRSEINGVGSVDRSY